MGHTEEPSQESDSQQSKVNDKEEEARLKKEHSDRKLSEIEQKEIDNRVILWAKNKNFIFMMSSLHQIIWSNSSWETVHHFDLLNNDNEIDLAKRKALLTLHPDKQHGASTEQKYLATRLFSVIKQEWDTYIKKKKV
ncbi:J domain-containing protein required for chloroplast accumulation response 1 [Arabidopsis lyrata subsp. lyrata]|nr:J domain-containing protein required for chloroplast accumulation response 1 [Arabidopsis lyrata subsp. lyrata]|eukprot:XP_020866136.1 J domain-containing protein required for chloroplast accumulation response 1 [Arabidopsis lyrata subsp. lyrata]